MKRRTLFQTLMFGGAALLAGGAAVSRPSTNRYYKGPQSDHFDGTFFFNPNGQAPGAFLDLVQWQLGGGRASWPASWPSPFPPAVPERRVAGSTLRVTMVGHATVLVQVAGLNFLIDPVWSERVSPVSFAGPKRVNRPGIALESLPAIDLVLISHNHYDHLDLATLKRLKADHDPLVVTPLGNDTIIHDAVPDMRVTARDWGESVPVADGVQVHLEPVHHWSARWTADRRMALWCGFVVNTPAGKIYLTGDTGFHEGVNYAAIPRRHGAIRLAVLPIGAYEPRWFMAPQHQDPAQAVQGMRLCGAKHAVGCHWGTFRLTNEAVDAPREALFQALDEQGVARETFRPMLPGEVWDVPEA